MSYLPLPPLQPPDGYVLGDFVPRGVVPVNPVLPAPCPDSSNAYPGVPYRVIVQETTPKNHATPNLVKKMLPRRTRAAIIAGDEGAFDRDCRDIWIPMISSAVIKRLKTPFDYCLMREFQDGNGMYELTLQYRNILNVLACYLRILPSNLWYVFNRIRNIDGTEFSRLAALYPSVLEPGVTPPETIPPNVIAAALSVQTQTVYTGIEDADLLVDTRARTLKIPPRVLYAGVSTPLWNYTFHQGVGNVEIHYLFGFPAVAYEDGSPLQFDATTGCLQDPKPGTPKGGTPIPVDWSSGMPAAISTGVARLTANWLMRQNWRDNSQGLSSISVDGGSESYGSSAYGGDLDEEDKAIWKSMAGYGVYS